MGFDEAVCPHCLARGTSTAARSDGLVTCRDCGGAYAVQPCGAAAVPLPDHIAVVASRDRFAVVLKSFFVTFGAAPSDLALQLDRDRFSWPAPGELGPLRFSEQLTSIERSLIARFAWRRYTQRGDDGEIETVSDLTIVGRDAKATRAGLTFPGRFGAGGSIATLLDWANESWFDAPGSVYRAQASTRARPELAVLRKDGRVERFSRTTPDDPTSSRRP